MSKIGPLGWILGLGAGALAIGSFYSSAVKMGVQEVRDELFVIGPNCEISLREGVSLTSGDENGLDKAKNLYFIPLIKELRSDGVHEDDIGAAVMDDLFPECEWPPPDDAPFSQRAWYVLIAGWMVGVIREIDEK